MAGAAAMTPVSAVGRLALSSLRQVGAVALFALRGLWAVVAGPWYLGQVLRQLVAIGFFSLPVIGLTAVFTGAALALNIYTGGGRFNAEQIMPQIVALGITRELGPVLAALMLAGRVAATMAAEIGAMRATEQIDAMKTLSTDPYGYLVAPRLVAAVIALPLLTVVADIIGVAGGWGVAVGFLDFNPTVYIRSTVDFVEPQDVGTGLLKAMAFGFIVALMGCHHGYNATGGARGVGRATTQAVVSAAILIFATDYVLTTLFTAR
ncbi:ABC transporter permease [Phenylobacterium sp.]|uniref:MlaE family ABC transporter permease n=1 Tax=Phenylobacterium sp. TaxID=1871053 RepID=UPI00271A5EB8|nr:ABC transporter permease [Phenylobacterium sp.]MDO8380371.1 ABC transporter permease [Phenylobacterium sp.]